MKTLTPPKPHVDPHEGGLSEAIQANDVLHKQDRVNQYQSLLDLKRSREKMDAERRPLFFFIGLSLSLLFAVIAFNWKVYDETQMVDLGDVSSDFDEILEVPPSLQSPPPPPKKVEVFVLREIDDAEVLDEVKFDLDVELTEDMAVKDVMYDVVLEEPEEEKAEEIFQIVEDQPQFPGGLKAFYAYVAENIVYPDLAKRLDISGRVFVRFVIEKDGSITDVQVVKGIGGGCDEEAVKVLENSPKWIPGKQRGNNVRVYMTVPILFLLKER